MSDASTQGPAFGLITEEEVVDSYAQNDDVLDEMLSRTITSLEPEQMEDIIARANAVGAKIAERETKTRPSAPEKQQNTPQVRAPEVPKRKTGRMMARLPPAASAPDGPVAVPSQSVPDKDVSGESRKEEASSEQRTPIPDKNMIGESRKEESEAMMAFEDVPSAKFGSPEISDSWDEDPEIADARMEYPETPEERGGMYGMHDPVLSTTSMHLSEFRSEVDEKLSEFAKLLKDINHEINNSQTKVLDRIRALERKLAHDPPLSVPASKVSSSSSTPAASKEPETKAPRMSLADRIKQRNK